MISQFLRAYYRAANPLWPDWCRSRLPVTRVTPAAIHLHLGGPEYLAIITRPRRQPTPLMRALRLALGLHPLGTQFFSEAASKDSTIYSWLPDYNGGSANNISTGWASGGGYTRLLLAFDLSSIPDTATLTSTTLSLFMSGPYNPGVGHNVTVQRIKRTWTEMGVTFNKYDGTNSWQVAGATGANDLDSTVIGTRAFVYNEDYGFKDWSLSGTTRASLEATAGQGWLMKASIENNTTRIIWTSSEYPVQYHWCPKITIIYTVPSTSWATMAFMGG